MNEFSVPNRTESTATDEARAQSTARKARALGENEKSSQFSRGFAEWLRHLAYQLCFGRITSCL